MATLQANNLQGQSNNHPKIDPELALLQDTWLDSELEVIDLRARKRKGESVGEVLAAAKKRRNVLWKQLLGGWKKGWKRERKAKSKVTREPAAPVEQGHEGEPDAQPGDPVQSAENVEMAGPEDELQMSKLAELGKGVSIEPNETYDVPPEVELEGPVERRGEHQMHQPLNVDLDEFEWSDGELRGLEKVDEFVELGEQGVRGEQEESEDSDFDLDELEEVPEELEEPYEPPHKRTRLEASQPEVRPRSEKHGSKNSHTTQQKDIMRAWLCENLGIRSVSLEMLEPVAEAAGLTAKQVRDWINAFYHRNPTPTLEQAMAWRSLWYRDVLNEWLAAHRDDPYPNEEEKQRLARETGKSSKQINEWFHHARQKNGLGRPNFFSPVQLTTLRASFEENIYPSAGEKQRLATETGLSFKQVDAWFMNQRNRAGMAGQRRLPAAPLLAWLHANMEDPYLSLHKRWELAEKTGRTEAQVAHWFSDKRQKIKRNKDKKEYENCCPCCGKANV